MHEKLGSVSKEKLEVPLNINWKSIALETPPASAVLV